MQIINKLLRLQNVYIFFISYVLFIIIFSTTYLSANTFKVSDIEISSPFEVNFSKSLVIDEGFKTSFSNLLSMITTSGDKYKVKNIKIKELKGMIDSFTISDEKFINNEYFAKLETTFNKRKILNFLEKKNIFPSIPIKNKVLLIPILLDTETDSIHLFNDNIFYSKWNDKYKNYHLLDYLLPSEDIEDLNKLQEVSNSIETYDFVNLIKKYDLQDYIILIIHKNKDEIKILSKINYKNSLKINNQKYSKINLYNENDIDIILDDLKNIYEDEWKKNNEINTSIKLPLTISIKSKDYKEIINLEETLANIDLISSFYILNFNNKYIQYKIIYNGSPKTFFNDMSNRNFDLIMENKVWTVK
ncbi:hypothetical protein OAT04_03860 [Candidatus Pelagibacter sp.]|jgi:hypothetical protein|nr:hypothetical protein [Candidatus Pelagibacter sp.]MDC1139981.1 hypothetical protein [Candidatus Pelagibacter sp.]